MSRALSDPHHPGVYALLLRTGVADIIRRRGRMNRVDVLKAFRSEVPFAERGRMIARLREVAPLGVSRSDLRLGRTSRV